MKWIIWSLTGTLCGASIGCTTDLGDAADPSLESAFSPPPGPTPSPGPLATVASILAQPTSTTAIADLKPLENGNCAAADYSVYDMANTVPAVSKASWPYQMCVKPFADGETSVIQEARLVAGTTCPLRRELLLTFMTPGTDFTQPRWAATNSICILRQKIPVKYRFVAYFTSPRPAGNAERATWRTAPPCSARRRAPLAFARAA